MAVAFSASLALAAAPADKMYALSDETAASAPTEPIAKPQKPRKVLVYGQIPTHPESVVCCFYAMEQIAKKSGAFEALCSGDPAVLLPGSDRRAAANIAVLTSSGLPRIITALDF